MGPRAARGWMAPLFAAAILAGVSDRPVLGQDVSVRARVDRARIAEGEEVVLSVDIAGQGLDQVGPPDISRIQEFEIVGGPGRSHRFQWIDGRTSTTISFTYVLRPRGTGERTIPPLGLLVQGRTYHTEGIRVEVVAGAGAGRPAPGLQPPAGPGRGIPPRPQPAPPGSAPRAGVLLRAEVDTRNVFIGQQVTLKVVLATQTEVLNLGLKDTPAFPGFWVEEIKLPENLEARRTQIGSEAYNEYTLLKRALFPTGSGTLTIPGLTYQIQVRRRSSDPIESFFFTPTETITRRTEPITIQVQPPPAGRPAEFSGAVGQFSLSVTADRREARVNDAVGVKIRVAGEGNLNAVNALPLGTQSDFKQYAPRVSSTSTFQGDRLRSERIWDYVLIPLAPGSLTIPAVTFSFFDPRAGGYRTVSSAPIAIQVAPGPEGSGAAALPAVHQRDIRALRQDIHYIKPAPDGLRDRSWRFYRSPFFIALLVLPVAADVGIFAWARRQDRWQATARQRRDRRARRLARKRLKEARRRMSPATSRVFYAEVSRALAEYVADKFDVAAAGLTHDRIEELLVSRGAPDALRAEFHRCLEACDYARFAPASSDAAQMRTILDHAEGTLVTLERALSA